MEDNGHPRAFRFFIGQGFFVRYPFVHLGLGLLWDALAALILSIDCEIKGGALKRLRYTVLQKK